MTRDETGSYLGMLKSAFPSAAVLPDTANAYAGGLADVPLEAALAALPALIRSHDRMALPTVAAIRSAAGFGADKVDWAKYRRYAALRNAPALSAGEAAEYAALSSGLGR